jgi:CDP-glycerol glycerophosphotransferase (TagB/SpsB family)
LPFWKKFPVQKNKWIFGAQNGEAFIDNSKYFFEYVNENHENITPIWITRSKEVIKSLRTKKYKVYHNLSLRGIWYSATAEVVIFCTTRSDILFVFPKRKRKIVNLWHGMPMKKIAYDHAPHKPENKNWRGRLWDKFVAGFQHKDVDLIPSTSEFFVDILRSAFRNENVVIAGQARTDAFDKWDPNEIKQRLGFSNDDKIVVYMPTHRAYGKGEMNPRIFEHNEKAQEYFEENKVKIVWKFHKNMLKHYSPDNVNLKSCFVDLTGKNLDPQELLYISDILITDYSSCYIDYLLLKRPVIIYLYDNYETEDNELYFSPQDHNVGEVCYSEKELLRSIQNPRYFHSDLYHKYTDSNSCERIMQRIK